MMDNMLGELNNQRMQNYINDMLSDTAECYMIYRKHDNSIEIHKANHVTFDFTLSMNDSYTIGGDFELSTLSDEECVYNCRELLTEYKQIKEYEDRINLLEGRLKKITGDRNKWWSRYLHKENSINPIGQARQTLDDVEQGKWFAIFMDIWSDRDTNSFITIPLDPYDEFFESDYWSELFTKNETITFANFYEPPNVTYDKMGINHWFVVCDADSYNDAIHHLQPYPDSSFEVIRGTKDYMYNRLNEIWKSTFGKEHKS